MFKSWKNIYENIVFYYISVKPIPRTWLQHCRGQRQPAHPRWQRHIRHQDHWRRRLRAGWQASSDGQAAGGGCIMAQLIAVDRYYRVLDVIPVGSLTKLYLFNAHFFFIIIKFTKRLRTSGIINYVNCYPFLFWINICRQALLMSMTCVVHHIYLMFVVSYLFV